MTDSVRQRHTTYRGHRRGRGLKTSIASDGEVVGNKLLRASFGTAFIKRHVDMHMACAWAHVVDTHRAWENKSRCV